MTLRPARSETPTTTAPAVTLADMAEALEAVRAGSPLVQCLTNIVVANFTANVLLAVGAVPAMVDNPAESGPFAQIAGGVLINVGTPYVDTAEAMQEAVLGAARAGTPWVLDPVAAGALEWRTTLAHDLVRTHPPAVLRGNASEVMALAGGRGGRGVESTETVAASAETAGRLASDLGIVVAVSGEVDHLTDGSRVTQVANGHLWLTKVTGAGCALGALMAGFAAVVPDRLVAATAATATLTVAADAAAARAHGPGSFAVGLLDELMTLTPESLAASVRLS